VSLLTFFIFQLAILQGQDTFVFIRSFGDDFGCDKNVIEQEVVLILDLLVSFKLCQRSFLFEYTI
jgi:hypothetical protein